jgi:hypothetical protein
MNRKLTLQMLTERRNILYSYAVSLYVKLRSTRLESTYVDKMLKTGGEEGVGALTSLMPMKEV